MSVKKDLLVIGSGSGGIISALRGSELGLDVVLAEKEDVHGGIERMVDFWIDYFFVF